MSKSSIITLVVIIVVVVIGGVVYWTSYMGSSSIVPLGSSAASSSLDGTVAGASSTKNTGQLFAGSPYAANAYLISSGTWSANTKKALSGFNVQTSTNPDGSMQFTLNATNPEYQTQTYTVQSGEQLYFIESNLGDDSGNEDNFPGDDKAVLVDQNGYIVSSSSASPGGKG